MSRQCGGCTLCCKLLPMQEGGEKRFYTPELADLVAGMDLSKATKDFDKPAGKPCPHQRHHKGCAIYDKRPLGCQLWACRWLVNDATEDLSRPDRSHYVIDILPDFIRVGDVPVQVVQIWCDPDYPDAHRDPALRAYLERLGENEILALIRFGATKGLVVVPPNMTNGQGWIEVDSGDCVAAGETWPDEYEAKLVMSE